MKAQCIAEKLQASIDLVRMTRAQGISLSEPLPIEQVFYGDTKALLEVESEMMGEGYRRTYLDEESVGMTIDETIHEAWVQQIIPKMCELAERTGTEYDGWNVDVSSQTLK